MHESREVDTPALADIFVGNSDMAALMRRHDWSATPLAPPRTLAERAESVAHPPHLRMADLVKMLRAIG